MTHKNVPLFMPAAPPGGGYLVLYPSQIANWDLVCLIKSTYPLTKIIVNQMIPMTNKGSCYRRE